MYEQMTIFDFLRPQFPDINDIPVSDAAQIVGENLGITFKYDPKFDQWQWKKGKLKLSMEYGRFILDDCKDLFLGTDYEYKGPCHEGGGSPCSGIKEAIDWFRNKMEKYT